ncbi:MAG TPA: rhamnose ABC transporter substrate-binding protein, partial [Marmoricola sp.]
MKFPNGKMAGFAAVTLACSLALAGCGAGNGGGSGDEGSSSKKTAVTFIPKNLGNPYFDTSDKGGEKAVKEYGGTYSQVGPQEGSPDAQVQYIDTEAQKHT